MTARELAYAFIGLAFGLLIGWVISLWRSWR